MSEMPGTKPNVIQLNEDGVFNGDSVGLKDRIFGYLGKGPRKKQEDRVGVGVFEGKVRLVVADGMGGMKEGDVAAQLATDLVVGSDLSHDKLGRYLGERFERANTTGSTTLSVVDVDDNGLMQVFRAGDVRVLVFDAQGKVQYSTRDHNEMYSEDEEEIRTLRSQLTLDRLKELQSHVLSGLFGTRGLWKHDDYLKVYEDNFQLQKGYTVLVCSDGLTKAIEEDTGEGPTGVNKTLGFFVSQIMGNFEKMNKWARSLTETSDDNVGIIAYRYE